jgi:tetratricopeptide (TPR) repeat protein
MCRDVTRCLPTCALLGLSICLCCAARVMAAQQSQADPDQVLQQAIDAYDDAVGLARQDEETTASEAQVLYKRSIGGFLALIELGFENAAVHYNIGNAYYRAGDLGRAILHYRRAARLNRFHPGLQDNLRYVRERVSPQFTPAPPTLSQQLFAWLIDRPADSRWGATLVLSCIGALLLSVYWVRRRRPALVTAVVLISLGCGVAGLSIAEQRFQDAFPAAVVVKDKQPLRIGRGEGADLAIQESLGAGVELRIHDQRGDWVEIELPTGVRGWLPANAVERI